MTETSIPPPVNPDLPSEPPAPAPASLLPGAGAPLVPGPPGSVRAPIESRRINAFFGISGVLGIVAVVILVIVAAILVLALFRPR